MEAPKSAHTGYAKSLYDEDWFDSGLEKQVAVILDDAPEITLWARLQRGDLRIVWESDGRVYEPDFVAVDAEDVHWVVEAKADRDLATSLRTRWTSCSSPRYSTTSTRASNR